MFFFQTSDSLLLILLGSAKSYDGKAEREFSRGVGRGRVAFEGVFNEPPLVVLIA